MKVIFSDEKRFTLNDPDNLGTYLYKNCENIKKQSRTKRFNGGGVVMILGAISSNGNLKVKIIHGKYTAKNYKEDLENEFIPWSKAEFPNETVIWQQDNASIHTSVSGTDLFSRNNITLLDWPSHSPDINIIENFWSSMNEIIYKNKQYYNTKELINAIHDAAQKIGKKTIINLYETYSNRLIDLIKYNGQKIYYFFKKTFFCSLKSVFLFVVKVFSHPKFVFCLLSLK